MKDIHLAAVRITEGTKAAVENLGLTEDFFYDCENCSPTTYHATFRGDASLIDNPLWRELVQVLTKDSSFVGVLEEEDCQTVRSAPGDLTSVGNLISTAHPLAIQICPSDIHKACDVHLGVRLDGSETNALAWLRALEIASFEKRRDDGLWRIFTATFDTLDAGTAFFELATEKIRSIAEATWKAKLERTARFFRQPSDAPTLPITFTEQLQTWLIEEGAWKESESL